MQSLVSNPARSNPMCNPPKSIAVIFSFSIEKCLQLIIQFFTDIEINIITFTVVINQFHCFQVWFGFAFPVSYRLTIAKRHPYLFSEVLLSQKSFPAYLFNIFCKTHILLHLKLISKFYFYNKDSDYLSKPSSFSESLDFKSYYILLVLHS